MEKSEQVTSPYTSVRSRTDTAKMMFHAFILNPQIPQNIKNLQDACEALHEASAVANRYPVTVDEWATIPPSCR